MSLSQPQQTALSTTLLHLEQSLDEIERLLNGSAAGIMYTTELNVGPATVEQIQARCSDIRAQMSALARAFGLPRQQRFIRQIIMGELSSAWVNLEEVRPRKLKRYGGVDPALMDTLEPSLARLIQLVQDIQDLTSRGA